VFTPLIDTVPIDIEVDLSQSRPTITIPLAASENGRQWVAVEARLWPCYWRGVKCHEFKFAIIFFDDDTEAPAVIFDRNMAEGYVGLVRSLIMPCVRSAAEALVRAVQPDVIYRATYLARPPEKSLPKHHMITDTLERAGYEVAQTGTDQYGRQFWIMTKLGGA
jgi:hypothetical protein